MTPHNKLTLANSLMLLGAAMPTIGMLRLLAMASAAPQRMSLLGAGLATLGFFIMVGLIMAIGAFIWSRRLERHHPALRAQRTRVLRIVALLILIGPFLLGRS